MPEIAKTVRSLMLSISCLFVLLFPHSANADKIRVAASVSPKNWLYFGFTHDSRRLVTYDEISGLRTWDAATGTLLTLGVQPVPGETGDGSRWTLVGDTRLLGVTMGDHAEFLEIEIPSGTVQRRIPLHGHVRSSGISDDGRLIAYADEGATDITLINTETGRIVRSLKSPKDNDSGWYDPAFSHDGEIVAASYGGYSKSFLLAWSVADGRLLSRAEAGAGDGLAFASSSEVILAGSQLKLLDLANGKTRWSKPAGAEGPFSNAPAITPDGTRVILGAKSGAYVVHDARDGQVIGKFGPNDDQSTAQLSLSPDGQLVAAANSQSLAIWDLSLGLLRARIGNELDFSDSVAATPDLATAVLGAADQSVAVLDLRNGDVRLRLPGHKLGIQDVRISQDGKLAVSLGSDSDRGRSEILWWDAETGRLLRTIDIGFAQSQLALLADGHRAVFIDRDHVLKLWDLDRGVPLHAFPLRFGGSYSDAHLYISPDDGLLIVDENQNDGRTRTTKVYDIQSGKAARTLSGEIWSATVGFSADSRNALLYRSLGTCCGYDFAYWDVTTGAKLRKIAPPFDIDSLAEIAPSSFIITGGPYLTPKAIRFDAASGQFSQAFAIEGSQKSIVRARGSTILATDSGGSLSIWDAATGAPQVRFYYFQDGEWLAITVEGFFAGSPAARQRIHVIRGAEAISIDRFFQALYRPDLVRERLAGDPRGLVREAAARLDLDYAITSGNPPDVRLTTPSRGLSVTATDLSTISVQAEVTDRGGGIGRIEWRVNGVTAGIDDPAPPIAGQPLQLFRSLALDPGDNSIEVVAYNGANLVASLPARTSVAASSSVAAPATPAPGIAPPPASRPSAAIRPRLFVLVAGVNAYADQRIRLDYAVPDAKAVAQAFPEAAGDLYQSVDVKLMTDSEVTRGRLGAAFAELAAKILPTDVFVLYLAGHGKTVDGRYYYIPQDLTIGGELTNAGIDASVRSKAIAQDQLQRWFAEIPARKSLILFDTCDSGTLTGAGAETQQLERQAANDRLAQATGRSIITASAGSQAALEGYHGHGLFTYELLDGLGHADSDGNGTIEIAELAAFAYAEVVELSQKVFQRRQAPQMKLTANYPLAKQKQVLADTATPAAEAGSAYHVAQTAQVRIQPGRGATVARSLSANTVVSVIESREGWSLIASGGKPIGYVATRDLSPAQ